MLRAACEFDRLIVEGKSSIQAAEVIRIAGTKLPDTVVDALRTLSTAGKHRVMRRVRVVDLAPGMLLDEALLTHRGACLVPAGQEVTQTLILRLLGIANGVQLREPFRVQVPI